MDGFREPKQTAPSYEKAPPVGRGQRPASGLIRPKRHASGALPACGHGLPTRSVRRQEQKPSTHCQARSASTGPSVLSEGMTAGLMASFIERTGKDGQKASEGEGIDAGLVPRRRAQMPGLRKEAASALRSPGVPRHSMPGLSEAARITLLWPLQGSQVALSPDVTPT
jgi:hypothetical protein